MTEKFVEFCFRWPVEQTSPNTVRIKIGRGLPPMLNPEWVKIERLTEEEIDTAVYAIVRKLAILE